MSMTNTSPPFGGPSDGDGNGKSVVTKAPTKRTARTYVLIAIAMAVITFALLLSVTGSTADTLLVARTVGPVNALAVLSETDIEVVELPVDAIQPDAFSGTSKDQIIEDLRLDEQPRTQYPLGEQEQLRKESLTYDTQLSVDLEPNERLVSVSSSIAASVAGSLRPGDRVDVFTILAVSGGSLGNGAETTLSGDGAALIYANAEIVSISLPEDQFSNAISRQTSEEGDDLTRDELLPGNPIPGIYVLKVRVDAIPRIALAQSRGETFLAYRPAVDLEEGEVAPVDDVIEPTFSADVICDSAFVPDPTQQPALSDYCAGYMASGPTG